MRSTTNPYDPPESAPKIVEEGLEFPISFGGQLGMQELSKWYPQTSWLDSLLQQYRANWGYYVVVVVVAGLGARSWWLGQSVWLICFLACGFLILPLYGILRTEYVNRRDGNEARAKEDLKSAKPCRGYFDAVGGCWQDERYIVKFPWNEAIVEHDATAVTVLFWGSEAILYLPSRFFGSQDDYQRLRIFLHKKYSGNENAPDFTDLVGQPFEYAGCMSRAEIEEAQSWDDSNWPFERISEELLELAHQPKWSDWSLGSRVASFADQVSNILFGWLPLHTAYLIWLAVMYYQTDSWDFFWDGSKGNLFGNMVYFGLIAQECFKQVMRCMYDRRVECQFVKILFDASGSLSRQGNHFVWIPFSDQMRLISDKDRLGWEVPGTETLKAEFHRNKLSPEFATKLEMLLRSTFQTKA